MNESDKKEYARLKKEMMRGHITDEQFEQKCLELFNRTPEEIEEDNESD